MSNVTVREFDVNGMEIVGHPFQMRVVTKANHYAMTFKLAIETGDMDDNTVVVAKFSVYYPLNCKAQAEKMAALLSHQWEVTVRPTTISILTDENDVDHTTFYTSARRIEFMERNVRSEEPREHRKAKFVPYTFQGMNVEDELILA